jgi:hypothetical protein
MARDSVLWGSKKIAVVINDPFWHNSEPAASAAGSRGQDGLPAFINRGRLWRQVLPFPAEIA